MTLQYQTWRTSTVVPGGECLFWFPKGVGSETLPTLPPNWEWFAPSRLTTNWHRQWAWGIRVPSTDNPGVYNFDATDGEVTELTVTVVAPIARSGREFINLSPALLVPTGDVKHLQRLLNDGFNVDLAPGRYEIGSSLSIPNGAVIRGYGAELVAMGNAESHDRMFEPLGAMHLEGLTLRRDETVIDNWYIHHDDPYLEGNITIRNCTIYDGQLFQGGPAGVLVDGCRFIRASSGIVPSNSFWRNNIFEGQGEQHAYFDAGAGVNFLTGNRFRDVSRGIVLQNGASSENMMIENYMRGVRGGQTNAGECLLFEAGTDGSITVGSPEAMTDNTVIDLFITDSSGPGILFYGSGMGGTIIHGATLHTDSESLGIYALGGGDIGSNDFNNMECLSRFTISGAGVDTQTYVNCAWLERAMRYGNAIGPFAAVYTDVNTNWPLNLVDSGSVTGSTFTTCSKVLSDRTVSAYDPS